MFFYYSGHARATGDRSRRDRAPARRAAPAPVRDARDAHRGRARRVSERRVLAGQGRTARRRLLVQLAPAPRRDRRRGARVVERQRAVAGERAAALVVLHPSPARRPARRRRRQRRRPGLDRRGLPLRLPPDAARDRRDRGRRPARHVSRSTSRATARCRCRSRARRPPTSRCPRALEGKTLVEDKRAHTVVAETYKAKGAAVRIAVAPGDYEVLVRSGDSLARCEVTAARRGRSRPLPRREDRRESREGRRAAPALLDRGRAGRRRRAPRRLHAQPRGLRLHRERRAGGRLHDQRPAPALPERVGRRDGWAVVDSVVEARYRRPGSDPDARLEHGDRARDRCISRRRGRCRGCRATHGCPAASASGTRR